MPRIVGMKGHGGPASRLVTAALLLVGCGSAYYAVLEKVGIEKREVLVDRAEAARDA